MEGKSVKSFVRECFPLDVVNRVIPHAHVNDVSVWATQPRFGALVKSYLEEFSQTGVSSSHWLSSVPQCLRGSVEDVINYLGMLVAIDFRHWGERPSGSGGGEALVGSRVDGLCGFYATLPPEQSDQHAEKSFGGGRVLRGSTAMTHLLRCAVEQHCIEWYRPSFMVQFATVDEAVEALKSCFLGHEEDGKTPMWMPATRERVELLISVSLAQLERGTSFYKIWCSCEGYLYHPTEPYLGFIEQLLQLHHRYHDFHLLRKESANAEKDLMTGGDVLKFPVLKLALLTASAVDSAITHMPDAIEKISQHDSRAPKCGAFHDKGQLTVCCDYQIPKALRLLGLIEYDAHLALLVDNGVLLAKDGAEEASIRVAALVASELLLDFLSSSNFKTLGGDAAKKPIVWDATALDHMLWWIGRYNVDASVRHHLCRTIMY
ncbi:hypothetical protein DQ04_04311040 [Trypanosoma grayi]|uniref:hypothetical protein n=1 Tax=Trypanosoma grayi TaxID=71804 RepID=UPI0004F4BC28|nr:hypothetical protein DQ04_04311040 [Trypanosoma grayi]KEG10007.1 hypothetical protein DQ04_04311040 [Trypanosoma grayi]